MKNYHKRLICALLVLCCLVGMGACKSSQEEQSNYESSNDTLTPDTNDKEDNMSESDTSNDLQVNNGNNVDDGNDQEVTITFEEMLDNATTVFEDTLGNCDDKYEIISGETLESYYESSFETFLGVCKYQRDSGLELYEYHVMNGNHFATWYDTVSMVHVYWIECENELNIVHSDTGASSLPSKTAVTDTNKCQPSVTQLKSDKNNGMGYVVQLADGSFIIYDGGYGSACAEELWSALVELNGGSEQGIVIRSWLITHSHTDHFTCFDLFSDSYADKVTLETVMISPLNQTDAYNNDTTKSEYKYLSIDIYSDLEKYEGVNLLFVHTGMQFTYGDVKMEILFTADELYIAEPEEIAANFNNTSIVSRIYNENGSCLFLGDAGAPEAYRLIAYYGDYLKSDMCQVAHHGVEDFPLIAYRYIQAETLWYPCDKALYNRSDRDADVRKALRESQYTKEIIIRDKSRDKRYL